MLEDILDPFDERREPALDDVVQRQRWQVGHPVAQAEHPREGAHLGQRHVGRRQGSNLGAHQSDDELDEVRPHGGEVVEGQGPGRRRRRPRELEVDEREAERDGFGSSGNPHRHRHPAQERLAGHGRRVGERRLDLDPDPSAFPAEQQPRRVGSVGGTGVGASGDVGDGDMEPGRHLG